MSAVGSFKIYNKNEYASIVKASNGRFVAIHNGKLYPFQYIVRIDDLTYVLRVSKKDPDRLTAKLMKIHTINYKLSSRSKRKTYYSSNQYKSNYRSNYKFNYNPK